MTLEGGPGGNGDDRRRDERRFQSMMTKKVVSFFKEKYGDTISYGTGWHQA